MSAFLHLSLSGAVMSEIVVKDEDDLDDQTTKLLQQLSLGE